MLRTFPLLHVQSTTVAQPLAGTWITAGIGAPSNYPLTLTLGSAAAGSGYNDSLIFQPGDPVLLIEPNGTNFEIATVGSIGGIANTLTLIPGNGAPAGNTNPVTQFKHTSGAFGTGTFIMLGIDANSVFVQPADNNAGTYMYFGTAYNMTATFRCIMELPKVATGQNPYFFSSSILPGINPIRANELWVLGGSGNSSDAYRLSYSVL